MDSKSSTTFLGWTKASEGDIKKAYRKLARKYHPDISKEKDADKRMAELNEANAVLSDAEKRAEYDAMLDAPRGFAGGQRASPFQGAEGFDTGDFNFSRQHMGGEGDYSEFFSQMFGRGAQAQRGAGGRMPRAGRPDASIELESLDGRVLEANFIMKPASTTSHALRHSPLALLLACAATWGTAWAQDAVDAPKSVALTGILGSKALLVVDGSAPKAVAEGASYKQVQVVSVKDGEAQVRIAGQPHTLRMGESPVNVGGSQLPTSSSGRIVLAADGSGHFMTPGMINGKSTRFMVDTGATVVSLGVNEARKLGIDYSKAQPVRMGTANGVAEGWRLKLGSVRISDVELRNVDAVITSTDMPFVLLGNSFLNSFHMSRVGPQLTLDKVK
ncbi:hypothetical protein FQA39_LY18933 [Lamprigera yunnana]|nr:hypothetical protein FQA39_LY18933 [Lamprigera yunnana]